MSKSITKKPIMPGENTIADSHVKFILHNLFWKILGDNNINHEQFSGAIDRFISKNLSNLSSINIRKLSSIRGNLKKEFFKKNMTWRVFVKGLLLMNVRKFRITVDVYQPSGKVTSHGISVNLNTMDQESIVEEISESKDNESEP